MSKHLIHFYEISNKMSVEWKVINFREDKGGKIDSPVFLLSDSHFFIRIYPKGNVVADDGWVSLYLHLYSSRSQNSLEFTMGLKRVDGSVLKCCHISHPSTREQKKKGWSQFIRRSQLTSAENVFGLDDTLTVFWEARVADDSVVEAESQTSMPDSVDTLLQNIEQLYVSGCQFDVMMDVKDEKFSAHRSILSARSSVFRSMFELDVKERETGDVDITDCDPKFFGSFLLFLYSGKFEVVRPSNAFDLYATADKYNVQDLKEGCCECDLCVGSVCDVLSLAALYGEQELLKTATAYPIKNASKILKTLKLQTLLGENPTLANELFIETVNKMAHL